MTHLQYLQQARLIRQASQPPQAFWHEEKTAAAAEKARRRGKRKLSDPSDPLNKVPHNAIERRYRNNINDRIATLRAAVPALRNLEPKNNGGSISLLPRKPRKKGEPEDLVDGVSAATKLNKATILGKATEYIHYLKGRETQLTSEVEGLKELVRSLQGGEDILLVWMHEMEQTRREREAEKESLDALKPIKEEDQSEDPMNDLALDSDEDESSESPPESAPTASQPVGSYVMAAFLGLTMVGTSEDLNRPQVGNRPGAFAAGAGRQLLKRTSILPSSGLHYYDHVSSLTLVVELARFVAFALCTLFVLYPAYCAVVKQAGGMLKSSTAKAPHTLSLRRRRAQLDTTLNAPATSPAAMDRALRCFVDAPTRSVRACAILAKELAEFARSTIFPSRYQCPTEAPALLSTPSNRAQADVWIRLLEAETAWGAFIQRSLPLKGHTILHVARIAAALDDAEEIYAECEEFVTSDGTKARTHALLALALARLGSPTNSVGHLTCKYAQVHWNRAQACAKDAQPWIVDVLSHPLKKVLAACPTEKDASVAAAGAGAAARAFLSSPLLTLSSAFQMAKLYQVWVMVFPSIIAAASPTTFRARARRERELLASSFDLAEQEDTLPSEHVSSLGSLDVNAFLREFFCRQESGLIAIELATSRSPGAVAARELLQALLETARQNAVQDTTACYLTRITTAIWAFLCADLEQARTHAEPLVHALSQGSDLLGVRPAAVACVELIMGKSAVPFPEPEHAFEGLTDDRKIVSLATAAIQWLILLRTMSANKAVFQQADAGFSATTLLAQTFALRRTLSRAVPPQSLSLVTLLRSAPLTPTNDGPLFTGGVELTLSDAKEAATDVLADLGRFLGGRAARPFFVALPSPSPREQGLFWIPEESDSGVDL